MASIPSGEPPTLGSRLHGNDGRRRRTPQSTFPRRRAAAHPQSSFPRRRESTAGAGDGFPSPRERRTATAHPTIVIPTTAGIHGSHIVIPATAGGRRWVPVSTGTTDGGGAPHNRRSHNRGNPRQPHRHSRDGGNPRRGAGDGFPSPRERRAAAAHPTIVIPATAGNPRRGAGDGFPSPRERRAGCGAPHNRHSHNSGNPRRGGAAMGSRLHGNDGRRRRTPQSSFPRRRESTAGGRRWVPVSTGTTDGGGAPHNRHSHNSGNPRQPQHQPWIPACAGMIARSFPRRRESIPDMVRHHDS